MKAPTRYEMEETLRWLSDQYGEDDLKPGEILAETMAGVWNVPRTVAGQRMTRMVATGELTCRKIRHRGKWTNAYKKA